VSGIPALDRYGERLGEALVDRAPRLRRRRGATALAVVVAATIAVPAAGTVARWAGLAGGETALPAQLPPEARTALLRSTDGRGAWTLEAYRAALGGGDGRIGVCVFLSWASGGSGRCVPADAVPEAIVASTGTERGVVAGVVRDAGARVEVTLRRGDRSRVVALRPAVAPAAALQDRELPPDLLGFALEVGPQSEVLGVRVTRADGTTLARVGTPAAPDPAVPAQRSPADEEDRR
jgi:hypothetical protein